MQQLKQIHKIFRKTQKLQFFDILLSKFLRLKINLIGLQLGTNLSLD